MDRFDVIVIGQGYAGLKAAKLAAERGLKTATVEKMFPGGLVMSINHLWPAPEGEPDSGPELTSDIAMQNMDNGIENVSGTVESLEQGAGGTWKVVTDAGTYEGKNVVIASGARLRKLGVPGEEDYTGRGVSECADCDGPMYQDQEAVVIGGGDSAFQEAKALTLYAGKVTLLVRGDAPKARQEFVDEVAESDKIVVRYNSEVTEIVGDDAGVTGVRVTSPDGEEVVPCRVIFAFVGLEPALEYLPGEVERDEAGAVVTSDLKGNVPGLWAIGASRSGYGGTLPEAAADAEKLVAAL